MRRRAFVAAGLALPASLAWPAPPKFERGLLWRATKAGVAPSHLFGVIHVPDPRVAQLAPRVEAVFAGARSLMVEFLPDDYARERFLEAGLFADGETLEQAIGSADFERAAEQLEPLHLPREVMLRLKPWVVLLNLRAPQAEQGPPIEALLVARARDRRLVLGQMEGVEEQIFAFDELPMPSQVALLKHSLAHRDELLALERRTVEAYLRGDLAAIWRLREDYGARHAEIAAHQAAFTKRVVLDRSVVMAFRMQRELRRGGAFVALGALHLYGEKGVLALLEADGYRVARLG
jgi:uncharacterized protein YbaP (TraB family)